MTNNGLHTIYCPHCGTAFTRDDAVFDFFQVLFPDGIKLDSGLVSVTDTISFGLKSRWLLERKNSNPWIQITLEDVVNYINELYGLSISVTEMREFGSQVESPFLVDSLNDDMVKKFSRIITFARAGIDQDIRYQCAKEVILGLVNRLREPVRVYLESLGYDHDDRVKADGLGNQYVTNVNYSQDGIIKTIKSCRCPGKGCKYLLPAEAGRHEQLVIGMLGTTGSGKTSFLAAVAHYLLGEHNQAEGLVRNGLALSPIEGDGDWEQFKQKVLSQFDNSFPTDKTNRLPTSIVPFFSMMVENNGHNQKRSVREMMVSFVDIPGEVLQDAGQIDNEFIENRRSILKYCNHFILCIEPRQLSGSSIAKQSNVINSSGLPEDEDVLTNVNVIVQNVDKMLKALAKNSACKPTIAVLLTKSDAVCGLQFIDKPVAVAANSINRNHAVSAIKLRDHRLAVNRFFNSVNPDLYTKILSLSPRIAFFSISAYGKMPVTTNKPENPEGYNIDLPILWLLSCGNCLPIDNSSLVDAKQLQLVFAGNGANPKLADEFGMLMFDTVGMARDQRTTAMDKDPETAKRGLFGKLKDKFAL